MRSDVAQTGHEWHVHYEANKMRVRIGQKDALSTLCECYKGMRSSGGNGGGAALLRYAFLV